MKHIFIYSFIVLLSSMMFIGCASLPRANPLDIPPTPITPTAPAAPTYFNAEIDYWDDVKLMWEISPELDVSKYIIYRGRTLSGTYSNIKTVWGRTSSYTYDYPSDTTSGTTYYYKMTAVNTSGLESDYSNIKSVTF